MISDAMTMFLTFTLFCFGGLAKQLALLANLSEFASSFVFQDIIRNLPRRFATAFRPVFLFQLAVLTVTYFQLQARRKQVFALSLVVTIIVFISAYPWDKQDPDLARHRENFRNYDRLVEKKIPFGFSATEHQGGVYYHIIKCLECGGSSIDKIFGPKN